MGADTPQKTKPVKADKPALVRKPIKKPGPVIYIGPALPGLASNAILRNGLPQPVKELLQARPSLGQLLVPVAELGAARRQLKDAASSLSQAYQAATKEIE